MLLAPGRAAAVASVRAGLDVFLNQPRRVCHGKHGFCSFREGRHLQLEGSSMTRRAAKYPRRMATALARVLVAERGRGYVIDGFSGSGIVGDAVRRLGVPTKSFEVNRDTREDMCTLDFSRWMAGECAAGKLRGVMLPVPCSTFSVAQSRSGRAIRSQDSPRGLPGLNVREQARVAAGNRILHAVIRLLRILNQYKIPWIIENPTSSYLWWDKGLQTQMRDAVVCPVHQCSFGAPWRKATTLAFGNTRY